MLRKIYFVVILAALLPFISKADWVSVDNNKTSNTPPQVTLLSDDNSSTVLKIDLSGFNLEELITEGKSYQSLDLLTDIFTNQPGYPELPHIAEILAVPDQAVVSIEVLETGEIQTFQDIYLPPARMSWFEGKEESSYDENMDVYNSAEVYPKEFASIDPPSIFRDFRIARVSIFPIRYIPATKELQTVSSITIRINYGEGDAINPKTKAASAIAPSFGKLYRSSIFNYQSVLDKVYGGKEEGHELMLCIMPDDFIESFQVYADWNRQSGTDVHVTSFSDINANSSNPDIIKGHIEDAYYDWDIAPTYVLIIGDDGVFPKKIITYPDYSFPNEDYFVEIEGNDHFPEMMIGRFTNQGDYRMQVMINKMLLYEKEPYTDETDWFKKGIVCSNNAYESQVETKRFAAARMLEDGGYYSVDTMMSDGNGWGYNCTYDLQDVMGALNDGRGILNYRGEGWSSGWSASCYSFGTSDVSNLSNGEKFSFVTSIGCGVAMFDTWGGNCFGEEWVQLGSLTSPRGGVAFVGPTSNTHTTYNNKIDKGIYTGMFQEGMDTPGQALLRGKLYMYNVYGTDFWVEYHYRVFCVLGDPSLHIWKDIPREVDVDHVSTITVGNNTLEFQVNYASSGQPVGNAEICITGEEIFIIGVTDTEGYTVIDLIPEEDETLIVTVRGGDVYPIQSTIEVSQPQAIVQPFGDPVLNDLDGNLDGLVNPAENCDITFTLMNFGSQSASNVTAILSSSSAFVTIVTTGSVSFGDLSPGNSSTGDPFEFYVMPACPVGDLIPLDLSVSSNSDNWNYTINVEVRGCQLVIDNFVVNDYGSSNHNYKMDPGETVQLFFSIDNIGEDVAPNVVGELSSSDQYITIEDPYCTFGTVNMGNSAINSTDKFIVTIDPSCPTGYLAEYTLKLYTQEGNYPYETNPELEIPVAFPISSDYTGPDSYGYYAYASTDAFYEQIPEYEWIEIDESGTQIIVPNVSDYTVTVNIPFTFKYYGIDYTQVRVSTDGWIAFGSGSQTAPVNTGLPNNDNVTSMAAVFWDDLFDIDLPNGKIYHYNDNANHRFIIEWDSIMHNENVGEPQREIFQAILLDPDHYPTSTGDGEFIFQYKNVEEIENNTIGIENHSENDGLQYVFNNNYDATANELMNGLAIKFTTEPPFVGIFVSVDENEGLPDGYSLEQNVPNPLKTETTIKYSIAKAGNVNLNIYNIKGELVRQLQNAYQTEGNHSLTWDGLNDSGKTVNSGIYFYSLQTEGFAASKKMFLMK